MNIEGRVDGERLDYIYDNYIAPALAPLGRLLDHLRKEGRIRPITLRALFFLIAHGAAAPFTLAPLARHFDTRTHSTQTRSPSKPRSPPT
jgi:hypothetical protein